MTERKVSPLEIRELAMSEAFEIASPEKLREAIRSSHPNYQTWQLIAACVDAALQAAGVAIDVQRESASKEEQ